MDVNPYLQAIREDVSRAAEAWGSDGPALADRLLAPLESALRLTLLEALSAAAAEITTELAPGSVEVRLRGRDPEFVVTAPPTASADPTPINEPPWSPGEGDDASMTRINLRLPQELKDHVEGAARLAGLSVNAWLVRAAAAGLGGTSSDAPKRPRSRGGDHYSGWVR